MPENRLFVRQTEKASIKLTRSEGVYLKDLIDLHYHHGLLNYLNLVGILPNNWYAAANGTRAVSIDWLNKLLSGINHECICQQEIAILSFNPGPIADDASYGELEDELLSEEIVETENTSTSSSSEKLQENSKTLEESRLLESQEISSTTQSNLSNFHSPTQ